MRRDVRRPQYQYLHEVDLLFAVRLGRGTAGVVGPGDFNQRYKGIKNES
jgi:hypothetical protein